MKILITGAAGRLASDFARHFQNAGHDVIATSRQTLDVSNHDQRAQVLTQHQPDVVINCAALCDVDVCEREQALAFSINESAPAHMATVSKNVGAYFIHISTDYVFDGLSAVPYSEEDTPHPVSVYGLSKHAGEIAVREANDAALVIRVAWVFGPGKPGFVDYVLRSLQSDTPLSVITDKWSSPTYTLDAAMGLESVISKKPAGLLHMTNHGSCSWWEYAEGVRQAALSAHLPLKQEVIGKMRLGDMTKFVGKRPPMTSLSTDKFKRITDIQMPPWTHAVNRYIKGLAEKQGIIG
ncbi:MAG: dTDP-4-dehydrorhamnose reductase [Verrucomicrobiota bacterium]|nr:dTDP-4-dehydrorhamnose reductase [Verrucomicrobiota bacterium]